jgi:hypothetical protein
MKAQDITAAAEALFQAELTGRQTGLLSLAYPGMTMDDAYAVQKALIARRAGAGRQVIGWKIGLTSKAMQAALRIDIPDSGVLTDDMLFADGAQIPKGRFIQPRVEAEIAFVMKAPLAGARSHAPMWLRRQIMWPPRWKFWIRGYCALILPQARRAALSIRFPTMPPMQGSYWPHNAMRWMRLICAGSVRS